MALVTCSPLLVMARGELYPTTGHNIDAAGENCAIVGSLYLPAQTGSKTLSAAGGGRIIWGNQGGVTFADPGTTLQAGIMDVTVSTGIPDGTFDVWADLVGGVAPIASSILQDVAMTSGTKTMAHGDLIAIVLEMSSRAGSDIVVPERYYRNRYEVPLDIGTYGYPYGIANDVKSVEVPAMVIVFDDGTIGWIDGAPLVTNLHAGLASIAFDNTSTPDEYAGVFKLPWPCAITGIGQRLLSIASGDTFELILYEDPFGTPAPVTGGTWAPDPDGLVTDQYGVASITPFEAAADTYYAVALRPTSANSIQWSYYAGQTGFDILKQVSTFSELIMAARSNQTGAFVQTQAYHVPDIAVAIGAFSDGTGGGGSEHSAVF